MFLYLMDSGMSREEYAFFMEQNLKRHCIMGNDYYVTNEHMVGPDGQTWASGEIFGYAEITRQYHARYRLPMMHTETNLEEVRPATRRSSGYGRSGRMSSGYATMGCRLSASPGTRSPIRWTGTRPCARTRARSIRWAFMISTGTSVRSVGRTRSWLRTGARSSQPRACACVSLWCDRKTFMSHG